MKQTTISQILFSNGTPLRALPRHLMPNLGTLLAVAIMLFASRAWAMPATPAPNAVPGIISYQGTLTTPAGQSVDGSVNMTFRLYDAPTGGTALWTEARTGANAVPVSDGLFNVMLGSLTPIPSSVWSNSTLCLGVRVGSDAEMTPREVVGTVPSALTVADGSITTAKIADGAVTARKLTLPSAHYGSYSEFTTTSSAFVPIPESEVSISLDVTSKLLIIFAGDIQVDRQGSIVEVAVTIDGHLYDPPKIEFVNAPANVRVTGSQSMIVEVAPGSHIVRLNLRSNDGVANAYIGHRSLTVLAFH